ncbi:hypothetical protein ACFY00_22690 [Kitasatospora sp. NPDC001540]|uniref:hypothetical protein n=1 Tax=Kitasatospora sp. NPDC001540 TaxID=3364014 RepID=UPI0036976CD1
MTAADYKAGSIEEQLRGLHGEAEKAIEETMKSNPAAFGRLMRLDLDIQVFEQMISGRPESAQLAQARKEFGYATYAASCGLYRLAFGSIRLFLELGFASVFFSANEYLRRKWLSDRHDFSWSKALDENEGVLSKSFVREFRDDVIDFAPHHATSAAECYRHCSQFIHGKASETSKLPEVIGYSKDVLENWIATAEKSAKAVLFLLYCRYSTELLEDDDGGKLHDAIAHSFGHIASVRTALGLPVS